MCRPGSEAGAAWGVDAPFPFGSQLAKRWRLPTTMLNGGHNLPPWLPRSGPPSELYSLKVICSGRRPLPHVLWMGRDLRFLEALTQDSSAPTAHVPAPHDAP